MHGTLAEKVALDRQFAVHRYLRLAETTAVGLRWTGSSTTALFLAW
jgi:hypothetical protein